MDIVALKKYMARIYNVDDKMKDILDYCKISPQMLNDDNFDIREYLFNLNKQNAILRYINDVGIEKMSTLAEQDEEFIRKVGFVIIEKYGDKKIMDFIEFLNSFSD